MINVENVVERVPERLCREADYNNLVHPTYHPELIVTLKDNQGRYTGVVVGNTEDNECDGAEFNSPNGRKYHRATVLLEYEIITRTRSSLILGWGS